MCIKYKASVCQYVQYMYMYFYVFFSPINKVLLYTEFSFCTHLDAMRFPVCNL